ncbi:MAG: hypothetical protein JXR70_14600, partial [Spirochaetales bacterium]|nr:hypothetical protein [Spirochaetales bacterium]
RASASYFFKNDLLKPRGALFSRRAGHKCYSFIARECNQRISKRSGVMESLACWNEMKAGNAQRNNQLNKYKKAYPLWVTCFVTYFP